MRCKRARSLFLFERSFHFGTIEHAPHLSFSENGNIVTKGDNNPRQDDYEVAREDVAGRYVTNLDFLTGVFKIFSKPVGYVALIGLPLMLITLLSLKEVVAACKKDDGAEGAKRRRKKRAWRPCSKG